MTRPLAAQVVTETAYKRYIRRVEAPGWNTSSHFAEVDFGEGREAAVVKLLTCEAVWPQAGNEAIGHALARLGELPCPPRAAVLVADASHLIERMGDDYPADAPRTGDVLAWCASVVPHLKDATWTTANEDAVMRAVLGTETGARIAAFDLWLCNADRNPRNLLRMPGGSWAVIDHEMLFMTFDTRGDWRAGPIDHLPGQSTLYTKAREFHGAGALTERQLNKLESRMLSSAENHSGIAAEAAPRLAPLLDGIYAASVHENVLRFIQNRAPADWMREQLNRLL